MNERILHFLGPWPLELADPGRCACFALELTAPGIFLIWFGMAAGLVTGLIAMVFEVSWQWQLVHVCGVVHRWRPWSSHRKYMRYWYRTIEEGRLAAQSAGREQHVGKILCGGGSDRRTVSGKIRVGDSRCGAQKGRIQKQGAKRDGDRRWTAPRFWSSRPDGIGSNSSGWTVPFAVCDRPGTAALPT